MGRLEPTASDPPPPPPPHEDAAAADGNQFNQPRSYVTPPEQTTPPYPPSPQKPYPPPPQRPAPYPPQPVQFPPPQQQPVQFPPPQQQQQQQQQQQFQPPQSYSNNVYVSAQQQQVKTQDGIAIGTQYLAPTQGWSSDLFDCANDPENAIITACFPCITFGQIAEIVDNGHTSCGTSGLIYGVIAAFIGMPCIMSCSYRTKIRSRYGLMETPAPDWVTHCFCEWCSLCQEYRELKARGFDPAIGWQGNMMRNQQQMQQYPTMTPPMNQTMM